MEQMDWRAIRAEYVEGTASYRALAEKHGVSLAALSRQARAEEWSEARRRRRGSGEIVDFSRARIPPEEAAEYDTAKKAAERRLRAALKDMDEAAVAAGIRRKALLILDRMFDECAEITATEQRFVADGVTNVRKLRDMTAIFKELTGGIAAAKDGDVEDLGPLEELLEEDEE